MLTRWRGGIDVDNDLRMSGLLGTPWLLVGWICVTFHWLQRPADNSALQRRMFRFVYFESRKIAFTPAFYTKGSH